MWNVSSSIYTTGNNAKLRRVKWQYIKEEKKVHQKNLVEAVKG